MYLFTLFYHTFLLTANACGDLLSTITDNGFTISGALTFHFSQEMAGELLDVYSNIYPSYANMIDHVCSGPCLALLVTGPGGKNSILKTLFFISLFKLCNIFIMYFYYLFERFNLFINLCPSLHSYSMDCPLITNTNILCDF